MSILTEPLPVTVDVDGISYPICTDFRAFLHMNELTEQSISNAERGLQSLHLFYLDRLPQDVETATARMNWFVRAGEPEEKAQGGGKPSAPDFSFTHDAGLIYAAFMECYGIDLCSVDALHWWKFKALFAGLDAECRFMQVRRIRNMDLTKIKDKDTRRYYSEMQKAVALPLPEVEQQRLDAVTAALMSGGDVQSVLSGKE